MYDVEFNDYMPSIWNLLLGGIEDIDGIENEIGVAALMGNLYAESGCTAYACQPSRPYSTCMTYINSVNNHYISRYDFSHYGCSEHGGVNTVQGGFGLAQWTYYTRKENLYDYMFSEGNNIGELANQIAFCLKEMQESYPSVWEQLTTATDLDDATDYVLIYYESPKNQSLSVKKQRRQNSSQIYNEYAGTTPIPPVDPQPPSPDTPIPYVNQQGKAKMPVWMYPCVRNKA